MGARARAKARADADQGNDCGRAAGKKSTGKGPVAPPLTISDSVKKEVEKAAPKKGSPALSVTNVLAASVSRHVPKKESQSSAKGNSKMGSTSAPTTRSSTPGPGPHMYQASRTIGPFLNRKQEGIARAQELDVPVLLMEYNSVVCCGSNIPPIVCYTFSFRAKMTDPSYYSSVLVSGLLV